MKVNWLDNIIGAISPSWGYRRAAWRQELERSYDAGGDDRLNAGWRVTNNSAETTDRYQRDTIRARARDLERNSDFMQAVILAMKRNVIGAGFKLQAKTDNVDLNSEIERLWEEWCKPRNCDVTAQQSFVDMCRMAVVRKKVDGGILFLKCYTNRGMLPFSLQSIEVDELDSSSMGVKPHKDGNRVVGGIEYDQYNRPVGYYIRKYNADGFTPTGIEYMEAKDVIFYWSKSRPSQIREISDVAAAMPRIRDISEFMTAVSVKERVAACLAVFIKKLTPGAGRQSPAVGRFSTATEDEQIYEGLKMTPGMIKELRPEEDISVVNPAGQGQSAADFVRLQQRILSAGQGLSYETASRDMSQVNYSSARQGLIEDEMTYIEEQQALQEKFMAEAYESFLISAVLAGKLNIPDFWSDKKNYMRHVWVFPPRKWIDPAKEANANKVALETGQKTYAQIAAENGRDWKEQIDEIAEIQEYAKSKDVELGGAGIAGSQKTQQPANDGAARNTGG
ncbi:MAG: phage portal protein [Clostridiales bacterium]|jgi:lambda family phage portal protein|nr:phage portal protein [Clostridiales bacterium]